MRLSEFKRAGTIKQCAVSLETCKIPLCPEVDSYLLDRNKSTVRLVRGGAGVDSEGLRFESYERMLVVFGSGCVDRILQVGHRGCVLSWT